VSVQHAESPAPLGGKLWTPFTRVLAGFVLVLVAILALRFVRGIGAVTNLSDGYPWGIWIAWDVVIGSALGASGFTVAFATYILNRGKYHPIVRPALLTALFGYLMAGASVFFDIGRYWDFWHILSPKYVQLNSVLFEVAICILSYTVVLAIEAAPMVLERLRFEGLRKRLDKLLFFFVALGVLLPTMHQSSLGTLLVVMGPQIDPLYQTHALPVLFLMSTIGMGLAAVVVEGSVTSLALRRPFERDLLGRLASVGRWLSFIYLVVRFADLGARGMFGKLVEPRGLVVMFWLEVACFAAPMVLLWGKQLRRPKRIFVAASLMALGGILYRIDAYLVAYNTGAGWTYFPSLGELFVTLGLIAFEILAFIIAIRVLPVLPARAPREGHHG
jgi:Ni/Fe-hydrogenase subunit HybB-like protein